VTVAAAEWVYEPAISVTHGDYSGRTVNLSPRVTPDPGEFWDCSTAAIVQKLQFAPPHRRINAGREQPPRGAMGGKAASGQYFQTTCPGGACCSWLPELSPASTSCGSRFAALDLTGDRRCD
jgi:hypothetical protein